MNDNKNKTNAPIIKLPVRIHSTGSTLGIKDSSGRFIIRKTVNMLTHEAFDQLEADFKQIVAALNEADALRAERDDLAMFVRRFLGSKFVPHCELAVKATDYLQRKGLQGSLLRDAAIKPNAAAGEEGTA